MKKKPAGAHEAPCKFPDKACVCEPIDELWTCRDGRKLLVGDMDEEHVRNALRMVIRRQRRMRKKLALLSSMELFALAYKLMMKTHREEQDALSVAMRDSLMEDVERGDFGPWGDRGQD